MAGGLTITEKILAKHVGKEKVEAGEHILADVDFMVANDITAPLSINILKELSGVEYKAIDKLALVPDHFTPNKDIASAENVRLLRDFARDHKIKYFFEIGRCGIEHCLLPEKGLVLPGDLVIGADSHTCTYGALGCFATGLGSTDLANAIICGKVWLRVPDSIKVEYRGRLKRWVYGKDLILSTLKDLGSKDASYRSLEFTGEVISNLDMAQRFTICNMVVEIGAKNGIIEPDRISAEFIKRRAERKYTFYHSDPDAEYIERRSYDVSQLEPQIALPDSPSNVKSIKEIEAIGIDQVFIGSCTNGWYEDMKIAADVIRGKKVADHVRLIVAPATPEIYARMVSDGLLETFVEAEAVISPPTCGPCLGGHMGVLAAGERAVSTTNRNFIGRMGHPKSEVYLANPAVAAASAVLGKIAHPEEVA